MLQNDYIIIRGTYIKTNAKVATHFVFRNHPPLYQKRGLKVITFVLSFPLMTYTTKRHMHYSKIVFFQLTSPYILDVSDCN